jgi:hypothetical protein
VWIKVCNSHSEPDWRIKKAEPKLRMVFGKGKVQPGLVLEQIQASVFIAQNVSSRTINRR